MDIPGLHTGHASTLSETMPLLAVFENEATADAARARLIQAGVLPADVQVALAAPEEAAGVASIGHAELHGFWAKLKDLIAVERPHTATLDRDIGHIHAILRVDPPAASRAHIIALIESTGPIAFSPTALHEPELGVSPSEAPLSDPSI